MSSTLFSEDGQGQPLFNEDGSTGAVAERALDFCQRYVAAMERTRIVMKEAEDLSIIGPSQVTISRGDKKQKVDGFAIISEEKLRALDDATLASLARRGVLSIYAALQMSLANFSQFGET